MSELDFDAVERARQAATERLLASRGPHGHWEGRLSSSALSTATAACALALLGRMDDLPLVRAATKWLADHQNPDGGWGDTTKSTSNLSTTTLCWAAFAATRTDRDFRQVVERAEGWLATRTASLEPHDLAEAIAARYGEDRTFSVPILAMCAAAGRLGEGPAAWRFVPQLPFEFGAFPHWLLRWVGLPVVSYALPALIAIGQATHHHVPTPDPLARLVRRALRKPTLRKLLAIQPTSGGFLEAAPLTSFVAMSLAAMGLGDHPVAKKCRDFLVRTVRDDGSWPIDVNLATWLTTLSVNALAPGDLAPQERRAILEWLLGQQHRRVHPYTGAPPGGWAWTDLPGGVPDADDTAGALLALRRLAPDDTSAQAAAAPGIRWLLGLQNRDGGIPTFCRGWGKLAFDRSAPDITAHVLMAFAAWLDRLPARLATRVKASMKRLVAFLARSQRADGAWVPLWFGNEKADGEANPVYGTSRVLQALAALGAEWGATDARERGVRFLLDAQGPDGGWGGDRGVEPSIEETALATCALATVAESGWDAAPGGEGVLDAIARGVAWLVERIEAGEGLAAAPIGLYFARLWYYEDLYPLIFLTAALNRATLLLRR